MARGRRGYWRAAATGLVLLLAGCGADTAQLSLCRSLIPAFEPDTRSLEIHSAETDGEGWLQLTYRAERADGQVRAGWIACRFAGRAALGGGGLELTGVRSSVAGLLSPVELEMLHLWRRIEGGAQHPGPSQAAGPGHLHYAVQTLLNALVLSCLYGLLALGYSLVYGMIERINLAFGQLAMIGGFAAISGVALATALLGSGAAGWGLAAVLLASLVLALGTAGLYGWVCERLVVRRLLDGAGQSVLVATIGLALVLEEALRMSQGMRERWLPPLLPYRLNLARVEDRALFLSWGQLAVLGMTLLLATSILALLRWSRLGLALRASSDDPFMTRLLGVDVTRSIALAFALGGACAGAAGVVLALYYGGVSFHAGYAIGFKALAAAVIGGIGSVPGALLGGLIIALLETFWSAYLTLAYKDIAIFALLAIFLILRPGGLFGRPRSGFREF